MDETEITNSEYKQFVVWVRDSVTRTKLANQQEFAATSTTPDPEEVPCLGIHDYAYATADTTECDTLSKVHV